MRTILVILALSGLVLPGCAFGEDTRLTVFFPNIEALGRTTEFRISARLPDAETGCGRLLATMGKPWKTSCRVETEVVLDDPADGSKGQSFLERVTPGRKLIYAEARDQNRDVFLHGCSDVLVGTEQARVVTIMLGPVESVPCIVCEAEEAAFQGTDVHAHEDASGGFRVREFGETGDFIEFGAVSSGSSVTIRYSLHHDQSRQASVYLNGGYADTVTFAATGSYDTYDTLQLALPVENFDSLRLQIDQDDFSANSGEKSASIDSIIIKP